MRDLLPEAESFGPDYPRRIYPSHMATGKWGSPERVHSYAYLLTVDAQDHGSKQWHTSLKYDSSKVIQDLAVREEETRYHR